MGTYRKWTEIRDEALASGHITLEGLAKARAKLDRDLEIWWHRTQWLGMPPTWPPCERCDDDGVHHRWGPIEIQHAGHFRFGRRWAYSSIRAVTQCWRPRLFRAADEDCNSSVFLQLPMLGAVTYFYQRPWRPAGSGPCAACIAEFEADGFEPDPTEPHAWRRIRKDPDTSI